MLAMKLPTATISLAYNPPVEILPIKKFPIENKTPPSNAVNTHQLFLGPSILFPILALTLLAFMAANCKNY